MVVKDVRDIPRNVCNINQAKHALQIHTIFMTDSDHNYILEEIECRDTIEYKINISVHGCCFCLPDTSPCLVTKS